MSKATYDIGVVVSSLVLPFARRHVQVEHGVLFYHMAVRRVLPNDHVAPVHETVGRLGVHHRRAVRRAHAGHGRGVRAPAVGPATDVLGAGTEPVQADDVHMRRRRTHMFLLHPEPGKSPRYFYPGVYGVWVMGGAGRRPPVVSRQSSPFFGPGATNNGRTFIPDGLFLFGRRSKPVTVVGSVGRN